MWHSSSIKILHCVKFTFPPRCACVCVWCAKCGGWSDAFPPTLKPLLFVPFSRLAEGYDIPDADYVQWKRFHLQKKKKRSATTATATKKSAPTTDTRNDQLSSALIDAGLTSEEFLKSLRVPAMRGRRPTPASQARSITADGFCQELKEREEAKRKEEKEKQRRRDEREERKRLRLTEREKKKQAVEERKAERKRRAEQKEEEKAKRKEQAVNAKKNKKKKKAPAAKNAPICAICQNSEGIICTCCECGTCFHFTCNADQAECPCCC